MRYQAQQRDPRNRPQNQHSCPYPWENYSSRAQDFLPMVADLGIGILISLFRRQAGSLLELFGISEVFTGYSQENTPSLASNSFMFRRFEPRFLRRSGYSHSCLNRIQVPHFGFVRSHFNFLLRHDTQEIVFSIGTADLSSLATSAADCWAAPLELLDEEALA